NSIGGASPGQGNLISGNNSDGIEITGVAATSNLVVGNSIGLSATGSALANAQNGVQVLSSASSNIIGEVPPSAGNVIAFNGGDGIFIASGTNNSARGNSTFLNGGFGIDIDANGV